MSELDRLLDTYSVPPVPAGLAERAAAEAVTHAQQAQKRAPRRRDRRGGWKRPLWIGAASFGLALTSAVAATVVSGGMIEIPVVQQMVDAIPILDRAAKRNEPEQRLAMTKSAPRPTPEPEPAEAASPAPGQPGYGKARLMQKLAEANQQVEARRAAGLPTPRADRIERQAKVIVERREAAGLPTPTIEEVEATLALREMRRMWMLRRAGQIDPSMLTERQLARIANRRPPEKRDRFRQLPPDMQRQLVARTLQRMQARRAARQASATPSEGNQQVEIVGPAEPSAR